MVDETVGMKDSKMVEELGQKMVEWSVGLRVVELV